MPRAGTSATRHLRPSAEEWLLCVTAQDGRVACAPAGDDLAEVKVDACVLPVETLSVCPLWLRCVDDSLLQSAIELQLEKRGLLPETNEGELVSYRVVCREESRVLVLVMVLSLGKLVDLGIENVNAAQFSVSPLNFELPSNAMVVWCELGRQVVVFTRDGEPAHFQTLVAADERSLVLELSCLALQLESEGIIHPVKELVLAGLQASEEDQLAELLEKSFAARIKRVAAPVLKEQIEPVDLLPPLEQARRQLANKQSRGKKIAGLMAAVYVVGLLLLGGRLFFLQEQVASSRTRQEFLAKQVADVRQSKELWRQIQAAVDSDEYPLVILSLCVEAIPQSGVQLTEFGINSSGKIMLAGRADSIPQALAFKSKLTSQQNLSRYKWNFPQPHSRKKGPGAEFKATATRNDYVTN